MANIFLVFQGNIARAQVRQLVHLIATIAIDFLGAATFQA